MLQEVITATVDLEDVRSYRGELCQPHMVRQHHILIITMLLVLLAFIVIIYSFKLVM